MAADSAALMGGGADLASTIGLRDPQQEAGQATPQNALNGVIGQVSKYQRSLREMRDGAGVLQSQFPGNGQTIQQITDLTDQLQKLWASYMTDAARQAAPSIDAGQNLSAVLR